MFESVSGVVVGGCIQLDHPIDVPDQTPVRVTFDPAGVKAAQVEPVEFDPERAREAWESMKEYLREHPINSGGLRYTRDELHARD